ncbi:MAG: hypothetical protein L3J74_18670 [Bacteroidales bacterium]|nr:hypothetical protein [Bacteroidales bacterium]
MKKKILLFIAIVFFSQMLSAQKDSTTIKFNKLKNSFRIGLGYCIQGFGDQTNMLYQSGYQRKLNTYFEFDLGMTYFDYKGFVHPNFYEQEVAFENSTSIRTFDLMINFLIIDFNKHILKLGTGYSLQKVNLTAWSATYYYFDDNYNYTYADYVIKTVNDFIGSIVVNAEYGYRFFPHFSTTIYAKYYSENKYISLASIGLNLYYTF